MSTIPASSSAEPQQNLLRCPRCDSLDTKFCYYNNYDLTEPRRFCKTCRRYWTEGGAVRNVPIGGACMKLENSNPSPNLINSSFTMAENPKPRVEIVNFGSLLRTLVAVAAENFESAELVLKDLGLQIENMYRSAAENFEYDESIARCAISESAISESLEEAFISSDLGYPWARPGNHTSAAFNLEDLLSQFGPSASNGNPPIDANRGGKNPANEGVLDDPSELTMRYDKGKGIELHKVMDIGCGIEKLGKEKFCPPKENVASTSTPSNSNNSLHRSSLTDTDNGLLGAAGCSRWRTVLKTRHSRILNALVKGDQSKRNGACSDLEAGVTRETATTSRGINYSQTGLLTFAYTLMGISSTVPLGIMTISDRRMTKFAEKLILNSALGTLILQAGIISLIYLRGISSHRMAKVIFTIILSSYVGMSVLVCLTALRRF